MVALRIEDPLHEVEKVINFKLHYAMDSLTKNEEDLNKRICATEKRQASKDGMDEFFEAHFTSTPNVTKSGDCSKKWTGFMALLSCITVIGLIVGLIVILLSPVAPIPPTRVVNLTAINGRYGIVISSDYIAEVAPGGSAAMQDLHRDDTIVSVNGIELKNFSHEHIIALIRMRKDDVQLEINENRKVFDEL